MGKLTDVIRLDLSLIPGFFIRALVPPFMIGAAKYARGDWRFSVQNADQAQEAINRRTTSLLNHLTDYLDGVEYDEEGFHELCAVAWNALYILYLKHVFFAMQIVDKNFAPTIKSHEAKKNSVGSGSPTVKVAAFVTARSVFEEKPHQP